MPPNVYFELTRAFNARGSIVALASGQAVVHYLVDERRLPHAHERVRALADRFLPFTVDLPGEFNGDAQRG